VGVAAADEDQVLYHHPAAHRAAAAHPAAASCRGKRPPPAPPAAPLDACVDVTKRVEAMRGLERQELEQFVLHQGPRGNAAPRREDGAAL